MFNPDNVADGYGYNDSPIGIILFILILVLAISFIIGIVYIQNKREEKKEIKEQDKQK